jgi:rubredoxin
LVAGPLPLVMIMQTYRCSICGHTYDPKTGDADILPGTAFADLPADWRCPVCLAERSRFSLFVSPLSRLGL